ncbi:cytochrome c oxidase assembly factor Coa1 family protein [Enterovibrio norvegicus]|uniref:cytochrome c oxidase assembly factor Coa1 family protein n=1 Tax=Enterovibrio norvegicus TaxID=188144 RepID=UPI00352ECB68
MDSNKQVPDEIKGWNWGAFVFNFIWGIRFKSYKALWALIPVFGGFYAFVIGAKGNEWAWQNNNWESVEAFKTAQRKWSFGALAFFLVLVLFVSVSLNSRFRDSEQSPSVKLALAELEQSESFRTNIGIPYDYSLNQSTIGGYEVKGYAEMNLDIEGANGEGVFFFKASHANQNWQLDCLTIQYTDTQETDVVIPCD